MTLDQIAIWVGYAVMVCSAVLVAGGLFGLASFYGTRWFVRGAREWALLIEFAKWRYEWRGKAVMPRDRVV